MRKISIFIIAFIVATITSCDKDLDLSPQGSVDKTTLSDKQGIELMVTNAYAFLTQTISGADGSNFGGDIDNWMFGSILAGDANKGTTAADRWPGVVQIEYYSILANNEAILGTWNFYYRLIKSSNHAINMINVVEGLDPDFKNKRLGEMKFLRGFAYFQLRRFFKWVPYVDEVMEASENDPKTKNDVDIYPKIEQDLIEAIDMLPDKQDNIGRANKWAAKSQLAKVYMYESKFTEAVPLLKDIIDNGVNSKGIKYKLLDKYGDLFDMAKENNSETIFDVQYSTDDPGGNNANYPMIGSQPYLEPILGGWCLGQPSFSLVNSFQVDANGLPKLDRSYMDNIIPGCESLTRNGVTDVADKTMPVDPRLDHTVGRTGVLYLDWGLPKANWVRDPSNGGWFHFKKNIWRKGSSNYLTRLSALNFHVIRFADVLLWYAEALAETNSYVDAAEYVNLIRARAANDLCLGADGLPAANYKVGLYPPSYFDTKEKALTAIRFERKLELALEGVRFFDFQRWGFDFAKSEIDFYLLKEKEHLNKFAGMPAWIEYKMLFPIPEIQIMTMGSDKSGTPYLKQNPGY